jgi:hypothetical protein
MKAKRPNHELCLIDKRIATAEKKLEYLRSQRPGPEASMAASKKFANRVMNQIAKLDDLKERRNDLVIH